MYQQRRQTTWGEGGLSEKSIAAQSSQGVAAERMVPSAATPWQGLRWQGRAHGGRSKGAGEATEMTDRRGQVMRGSEEAMGTGEATEMRERQRRGGDIGEGEVKMAWRRRGDKGDGVSCGSDRCEVVVKREGVKKRKQITINTTPATWPRLQA
jgi:hypothetical protein